jgi:hypothetical protein
LINGESEASDELLRISVWISYMCYSLQMLAYCKVRYSMKTLPGPSPFPLGIPGAVMTLMISFLLGVVGPFALNNGNL